jgi:hypothetical protein
MSLKEKLEKLCRELQKENNKLKVCLHARKLGLRGTCADGLARAEREQNALRHAG